MKIAVNTRLLLPNRLDGIGWFTYESFKRIARQHPEHEFHFIFDRAYSKEFVFEKNVIPHVVPPQARRPFLFTLWYDWAVPLLLKKIKADLFISPDAMMSLRTNVPQIIAIHDLNFEHYPQDVQAMYTRYLKKRSPLYAKKAERIITVSDFSKQDIMQLYGVKDEKIDVVYNGVNENYAPISDELKKATRARWSNDHPYFVFVSSIHPRKNLQRLLPAFDAYKEETGSNAKLIVVGKKFWYNEEIANAFDTMKHAGSVVFAGRLEPTELHHLVASSIASVYPSYFEGFGIPILEAFKCGVPVITSNITSMPEVAGNAALLVNPFSIEELKNALKEIDSNEDLRKELIEKGLQRVQQFSWQRTSELIWQSIEKTLQKK